MCPEPDEPVGLHPDRERALAVLKAVRKHRQRLAKKLEAVRGDLVEVQKGPTYRRFGEALLAYLRQVPARARA